LSAVGEQGDFDNVRLSDDANVPEPGSMILVGLGLAATLAVASKRRHRRG